MLNQAVCTRSLGKPSLKFGKRRMKLAMSLVVAVSLLTSFAGSAEGDGGAPRNWQARMPATRYSTVQSRRWKPIHRHPHHILVRARPVDVD